MLRLPADLKAHLFGDHGAIRVACPACGRSVCIAGETMSVGRWADRMGVSRKLVYSRIARGWSPKRALTQGEP